MASEHLSPTPPPSQFHSQLLHSYCHFQNHSHSSPSTSSSSSTPANPLFVSSSLQSNLPLSSSTYNNNDRNTNNQFSNHTPLPFHLHAAQVHSAFDKLASLQLKQNYEKDSGEAQLSGQATIPKLNKVVADRTIDPQSSPAGRRNNRLKAPKNAKIGAQKLIAESLNGLNPATGCRYDSSLGLLTKKFVRLIQDKDGTLDLNRSADVLQVQKRRIYDITNVLEGIELIEKTSKNHIRWKGYDGCGSKELDEHLTRLKAEVQSMHAEECWLDESIREKQALLRVLEEDENNKRYLFLTEEDITALSCFQNQTLIVIKTPQASYLEVPDPDENIGSPQYKMIIRSNTGPIDLYLLSKYKHQDEDVAAEQVRPLNSSAWKCGPDRMVTEGLSLEQQHNQNNAREIFNSLYSESSGIQKIIPSDYDIGDDYWFPSNPEVSISELWGY